MLKFTYTISNSRIYPDHYAVIACERRGISSRRFWKHVCVSRLITLLILTILNCMSPCYHAFFHLMRFSLSLCNTSLFLVERILKIYYCWCNFRWFAGPPDRTVFSLLLSKQMFSLSLVDKENNVPVPRKMTNWINECCMKVFLKNFSVRHKSA